MNMENRMGLMGQPCRSPRSSLMGSEMLSPTFTLIVELLYSFLIKS